MDRLRALPGVESVGLVENVPLNEGTAIAPFRTEEMASDPDAGPLLNYTFAAGDYFKAMGIRVLRGRSFDDGRPPTATCATSSSARPRRNCSGRARIRSGGGCSAGGSRRGRP